jgi:ribose transport system substrate-binding protein
MKKALLVIAVLCMAFALVSCNRAPEPAASTSDGEAESKMDQLYIQVSALSNLDYFYDHQLGMKLVGEELGVRTEYVGPAEYDMNAMIAAFEQSIAKRPNGIVVVGFEPSLDSIVNKAIEEGIPVVTVDADLPTSNRLAFVGTGNFNAGFTGGNAMADLIGGSGKVALMTRPGQSNLEERIAGYRAALEDYPDIEIVQVADTQSDPIVAAQAAATLLQRFPDLSGFGCVEAAGGAGASTAVREAGKAGDVKIIAMDRGNEVLEGIQEGIISASIAQQTALMPYYATQILYNLNNSNVAITSDNQAAGVLGIPEMVDTGVIVVDSSNYEYFMR